MENPVLTIEIGACQDLKAKVSGEYPAPGATITVESWPKDGKREQGCSATCVIGNDNKWSLDGFRLIKPEYFAETARVCSVQAILQTATEVVRSEVKQASADIPYTVAGQVLEAATPDALACAVHALGQSSRAGFSVRITTDMVVSIPIRSTLVGELDGGGHTLTYLYSENEMFLLEGTAGTGVVKSLKVVYPDWRTGQNNGTEPPSFAGIVARNLGRIESCEVSLHVTHDKALCGGIAFESGKGSKITGCTVKGTVQARSVGGVAYRLDQASVENCSVTADFRFQEHGAGVAAMAEGGSTIKGCDYEGKFTVSAMAYASTRLCGGIAASVGNGSLIETCNAKIRLEMLPSGMGGYVAGIAATATGSILKACGAQTEGSTYWIFGGVAGKTDTGTKVEQCVALGNSPMSENRSVVAGLVADLGKNCTLSDSYASHNLSTTVYGGGLVGYASDSARIERCYCTSALKAKAGGGIRMRSKTAVEYCAGIQSLLNGKDEMARSGAGSGVKECIAFKQTQAGGGKPIGDTGETLKQEADFADPKTFEALGWDFQNVWQTDAGGSYPKLRKVTLAQPYTFPFLKITSPTAPYKFKTTEKVTFKGYAPSRASSLTWEGFGPKQSGAATNVNPDGQWTIEIGRFAVRDYRMTLKLVIDGITLSQQLEFTVET